MNPEQKPNPRTPDPGPRTPNPEPRAPYSVPPTPDSGPKTPNSEPRTPNPKPRTPNPELRTPGPRPRTPNPNPKPKTPDSGLRTPDSRPRTPNPKPKTQKDPGPRLSPTVHFVGAGPGDPQLLTLKAKELIEQADLIVFADSLVNSEVCRFAKPDAHIQGSSALTLEQTLDLILTAARAGKRVVRLQSGDPAIYGAINEQIAALEREGIEYEIVPGVSSAFAAAARLGVEMTVPNVSQTVIFTRRSGRASQMPSGEDLTALAQHQASMAIFLSAAMMGKVVRELLAAGYSAETPCCVLYKVTWPDEKIVRGTLADIARKVRAARFTRQAIILVGSAFGDRSTERSRLYSPDYVHLFRGGS